MSKTPTQTIFPSMRYCWWNAPKPGARVSLATWSTNGCCRKTREESQRNRVNWCGLHFSGASLWITTWYFRYTFDVKEKKVRLDRTFQQNIGVPVVVKCWERTWVQAQAELPNCCPSFFACMAKLYSYSFLVTCHSNQTKFFYFPIAISVSRVHSFPVSLENANLLT